MSIHRLLAKIKQINQRVQRDDAEAPIIAAFLIANGVCASKKRYSARLTDTNNYYSIHFKQIE
ncbi:MULTISPECIES: hypothetical protein [Raoultella]|uniref:hypothetical protein n=1 Tax=Raoultella TaxID=160674 RepID=UPI00216A2A66|nr:MULTISPECIES: hypothetical protein [Raoultella]MCS4271597.1 hypothetical protein [Raoultella sp. BIGb0132]MCS4288094.1 hypothetical protein [Raoultella terrigena]